MACGWWLFLAPADLAGHTVYAEVVGHSMEPTLHTGDLSVSRAQPSYRLGDLVVFQVRRGNRAGLVIHRLVGGSARTGWKTKGANHTWVDPWTIPNTAIAGRYWFEVPQFGSVMTWVRGNPLVFATVCTALGMLFYIPRRRRHIAPALAGALETAAKEPWSEGRSGSEYGVLVISAVAALVSAAAATRLAASHHLASSSGAIVAGALAWSGGFTLYLLYRLYDGRWINEPDKSTYALSGRLYRVDSLDALDFEAHPVRSAVELRCLAERERLPVLHQIDPNSGRQEFLLVTDGRGSYRWDVAPPAPRPVPSIRVPRHSRTQRNNYRQRHHLGSPER